MTKRFDIIVVGGGHAGTEAALAGARLGCRVLLVTHSIDSLGQMSCNPAIGGIGKGHLVKEIDALGGVMGRAADFAGIHFRTLNSSKGPAVRATRTQADRNLYRQFIHRTLENTPNLSLFQASVDDLIIDRDAVVGIVTQSGLTFMSQTVVLTVGTFLGGKIHIGDRQHSAGRAGDPAAKTLALKLREIFPHTARLKTGTPPRIDKRTVDFSQLQEQWGEEKLPSFSYNSQPEDHPEQVCCHLTYTNEKTHELIRKNLDSSPLFNGSIEGVGPRYCPSIEDKVVRFSEKTSHQIFLEPEGLDSNELYPNGISTSLPYSVQEQFIHSIEGLENAHITRPGYAIEYDFFDPRKLQDTLMSQIISGLFCAGQINGTTGYEEAAAQGLIAGANAAFLVQEKTPFTIRRDQGYTGVLIDDLITSGTLEPYRMFTSRAEYRLSLREDNADQRLTELGHQRGLVDDFQLSCWQSKAQQVNFEIQRLKATPVSQLFLNDDQKKEIGEGKIKQLSVAELLKRPGWGHEKVQTMDPKNQQNCARGIQEIQQTIDQHRHHANHRELAKSLFDQAIKQAEIQLKYEGYLHRQDEEIRKIKRFENQSIPTQFDYGKLISLSHEVQQKLTQSRPQTIGQAGRISGVTPAAISILLIALRQRQYQVEN